MQTNNVISLNAEQLQLYGEMYRCELCSPFTDPSGVQPFTARNAPEGQTIPVSHFGNISDARIWLLLTNPLGSDRTDPNVGHRVDQYAADRGALTDADIPRIFSHFSEYNFGEKCSKFKFWRPWKMLLDDLDPEDTKRFSDGGICAVDLIKCPTKDAWTGYVRTEEGKAVWQNCHGLKRRKQPFVKGREYLVRQIEMHEPSIVILAGTAVNGKGYTRRLFGKPDRLLELLIPDKSGYVKRVRTLETPRRLTVQFGKAKDVEKLVGDPVRLAQTRSTLARIIRGWTGASTTAASSIRQIEASS